MPADIERDERASPWLFLLGLVVFLGSTLLFVVDLVRGVDVIRSVAANGVGAIVLIGWAALDTYRSGEFEVDTISGATGTALLLYGLYLSIAGFVVGLTGLFAHDRLIIGVSYIGLSVGAVVLGYLIMPLGALLGSDEETDDGDDENPGQHSATEGETAAETSSE